MLLAEADEGCVPARAAIVPDNFRAFMIANLPRQADEDGSCVLCRARCEARKAGSKAVLAQSRLAFKNFTKSLAVERKAPAPASVGMSQFAAGLPVASCP